MSATSEDLIQRRLEEERARLARELGIEEVEREHHARPVEHRFIASQRPHTTVLFGGLTWKHEQLIHGRAARASATSCEVVPVPDVAAFQLGKEYGNNGQCNPTYFTVGNLVQYLQGLESQRACRARTSSTTTSSSPPARAVRAASACTRPSTAWRCATAGFDGFRVLLFQQTRRPQPGRRRGRASS